MLQDRFSLAGRLSVVYAFVTLLQIVVGSYIVTTKQSPGWPYVFIIFNLLRIFLWIYILSAFMRLLNSRFSFHDVDTLLAMLIWNYVFSEAAGMIRWFPGYEVPLTQVIIMLTVVFGILSFIVGLKLLKAKIGLYELARPFSYGLIVAGIADTTYVLFPFAVIARTFFVILLAAIFFRAVKDVIAAREEPDTAATV